MGNSFQKSLIISGIIFCLFSPVFAYSGGTGEPITVKADGTGDYPTIQAAIDAANDGDAVLVADGVYTGDGNRDIVIKEKKITVKSENGPENCIIDCNAAKWDFHRGFYISNCVDANTIIEGFTIINGYETSEGDGGGAFRIVDSNCLIRNCWLFNHNGVHGGAIRCDRSNAKITNCFFADNFAWYGSAIWCDNSLGAHPGPRNGGPEIQNCLFVGNVTRLNEGTIYCYNSDTVIRNCTLADNNYGVVVVLGYVKIINCILSNENWEIKTLHWYWPTLDLANNNIREFKIYQGDNTIINLLDGNIDADPCFVNPNNGDYRLLPNSSCIDAGDPNYTPDANETDLDGRPRIIGGRIDIGAYEFNHQPIANAGPNQTVYAWLDGIAEVELDGSASSDIDECNGLSYHWTWTIDDNTYEANGVNPIIELPVGVHTIELIVNDGLIDSEPNYVDVNVIAPLKTNLQIMPTVVNRASNIRNIIAVMDMPKGIKRGDISKEPFVLFPADGEEGIEAVRQYVLPCWRNRVRVFILFDKDNLIDLIPDNGKVKLQVVGELKSGQCVFGEDNITIIGKRRPFWPWCWRK